MIYLVITVISFIMGFKIGNLYQVLKITSIRHQINKENIEESIKKSYDKKIANYQKKIDVLEEKLIDLTSEYGESENI
ncbi:hypothetical protein [Sedimentibacter sp.]|uniref:hypothetical protein n=1 Tax=Sedimentibacter sp. TaxID=1960295 RepID=UPI0028ACE12E|nr:hypothetical protein [Sedimentibacter sp.]